MAKAISDVAKTIASAMKERKEQASEWRKSADDNAPFKSFFIKRLRAQLVAQKTLMNEGASLVFSLMQTVKGADEICADVRAMLNSISTERHLDEGRAAVEVLERAIEAEDRRTKADEDRRTIARQRNIVRLESMPRMRVQQPIEGQHEEVQHPFVVDDASFATNSVSLDDTV
ncbi:unnamed protein product [Toxocara canis]|uniref:Uncharacterized protein n=1 Tax=Toxocara canis TaxID=6265 RepID=A0A183UL48_TOXCA|nr:unnamed protein product [Toxocara canis]